LKKRRGGGCLLLALERRGGKGNFRRGGKGANDSSPPSTREHVGVSGCAGEEKKKSNLFLSDRRRGKERRGLRKGGKKEGGKSGTFSYFFPFDGVIRRRRADEKKKRGGAAATSSFTEVAEGGKSPLFPSPGGKKKGREMGKEKKGKMLSSQLECRKRKRKRKVKKNRHSCRGPARERKKKRRARFFFFCAWRRGKRKPTGQETQKGGENMRTVESGRGARKGGALGRAAGEKGPLERGSAKKDFSLFSPLVCGRNNGIPSFPTIEEKRNRRGAAPRALWFFFVGGQKGNERNAGGGRGNKEKKKEKEKTQDRVVVCSPLREGKGKKEEPGVKKNRYWSEGDKFAEPSFYIEIEKEEKGRRKGEGAAIGKKKKKTPSLFLSLGRKGGKETEAKKPRQEKEEKKKGCQGRSTTSPLPWVTGKKSTHMNSPVRRKKERKRRPSLRHPLPSYFTEQGR